MRLQLALNVADLDEAVEFYTKMFGVGPAKTKPRYANFAIEQPPLKLVLFEGQGESGSGRRRLRIGAAQVHQDVVLGRLGLHRILRGSVAGTAACSEQG